MTDTAANLIYRGVQGWAGAADKLLELHGTHLSWRKSVVRCELPLSSPNEPVLYCLRARQSTGRQTNQQV